MTSIYVALDVETTGLKVGIDEIIEVAAVKFSTSTVLETFQTLVKPRYSLPLKISRLTGIAPANFANAPSFHQVAHNLVQFVKAYPIIGHSIDFDIRMLQAQGMRFNQPVYDTFELVTLLMPGISGYGLGSLANLLGIPLRDAHRAFDDADATRQLFLFLLQRISMLPHADLHDITSKTSHLDWPIRDLFLDVEQRREEHDWPSTTGQVAEHAPAVAPVLIAPPGGMRRIPLNQRKLPDSDSFAAVSPPSYEGAPAAASEQPAQDEAVRAVTNALHARRTLLAEVIADADGPPSYLAPAACAAACRGEPVCIATSTAKLQNYLLDVGIPTVLRQASAGGWISYCGCEDHESSDALADPFMVYVLKDRSDYLCLQRYEDLRAEAKQSAEEIKLLLKLQIWLKTTTSGDRAELNLIDKEQAAWSRVNFNAEYCNRSACPHYGACFYFLALQYANAAHITLASHRALLNESVDWAHVIIDEAHDLDQAATDQATRTVGKASINAVSDGIARALTEKRRARLLVDLRTPRDGVEVPLGHVDELATMCDMLGPIAAAAREGWNNWFRTLETFITTKSKVPLSQHYLRVTNAVREQPEWRGLVRSWGTLAPLLADLSEGLDMLATLLADPALPSTSASQRLHNQLCGSHRMIEAVRSFCDEFLGEAGPRHISWITFDHTGAKLALNRTPLSVTESLEQRLFARGMGVVVTSSALTVNKSFAFLTKQFGVKNAELLRFDARRDSHTPVPLYIPTDMPEPNQPSYQQILENLLIGVCKAHGGNSLVHFTGINALRQAYQMVQEPLENDGFTVLAQSIDGSRRNIMGRFNEDMQTILFGLSSLWDGARLTADPLALVLTRLPFGYANDPISAARAEQCQDPFNEFVVPQAILRFRHLLTPILEAKANIRSVIVLNSHLLTKPYGNVFLESLHGISVKPCSMRDLAAHIAEQRGTT